MRSRVFVPVPDWVKGEADGRGTYAGDSALSSARTFISMIQK
jgi:hypothetical protein